VVLGLVLLAIVFLVPNGLIGLLEPLSRWAGREHVAQLLRRLAGRLDASAGAHKNDDVLALPPEPPLLPPARRRRWLGAGREGEA